MCSVIDSTSFCDLESLYHGPGLISVWDADSTSSYNGGSLHHGTGATHRCVGSQFNCIKGVGSLYLVTDSTLRNEMSVLLRS